MWTENSAPFVWTEATVVRHSSLVGIALSRPICESHWKWLGDHGSRNTLLHLRQEGGGRDNAPSDRQYSPYTRLSVAWRADVRFSRLRSTCWSNANFMMKSDTDFICRVLSQTSQSINPAAYLLFWHSVTVSGLRSPLILPCLYDLWTFSFPWMYILCLLGGNLAKICTVWYHFKNFKLWSICKNHRCHWDLWLYHVLGCVFTYGLSRGAEN